jgi:hypothetical protein
MLAAGLAKATRLVPSVSYRRHQYSNVILQFYMFVYCQPASSVQVVTFPHIIQVCQYLFYTVFASILIIPLESFEQFET